MGDKRFPIQEKEVRNFIENIIVDDLESGKHQSVKTRFPPEPNGFLHIGHAKAVCLNFGLAEKNPGFTCNLRFDDTNPEKEEQKYVEAIQEDIKWLGFDWNDGLCFSSDYFEKLYDFAVELIEKGLAYVDERDPETIRQTRGTMQTPGTNGPFRDRPTEESLKLFQEMKEGKHEEGSMVLRAKIDMASSFMCMRDPVLYRIKFAHHQRTGDQWVIYPMYDFTHCISDAIEGITHSICTLEFQDNRRLYDWVLDNITSPSRPHQYEMARLNLNYTVMSKRKLLQLVEEGHVSGWDDPRMPTISGMRRRGFTPKSIRDFCDFIGVGKKETIIDFGVLEKYVRDDLGATTKRAMGVLKPLKVTLTNWDDDKEYQIDAPFHPQDESYGSRKLTLRKTLYIESDDFLEDPPSPKKWFRLGPERRVRLRYGPIIVCDDFKKNEQGEITELICHYIEDSFNGQTPEGEKKAKGIIHWVDEKDAKDVPVNLYDRLFKVENPGSDNDGDFLSDLNPESLVKSTAKVEPYLTTLAPGESVQFERVGYFTADRVDSKPGAPVFNRTVTQKDSWAKLSKK